MSDELLWWCLGFLAVGTFYPFLLIMLLSPSTQDIEETAIQPTATQPTATQKPATKPTATKLAATKPTATRKSAKSGTVQRIRNAIIGQESGGDPNLLNASGSGATGYGQVMPENIGPWSQEALGRTLTQEQFRQSPQLQLTIIDHKIGQYWKLESANFTTNDAVRRVAATWYSGDPNKVDDRRPQYWNGDPYPSIADYSNKVLNRFLSQ